MLIFAGVRQKVRRNEAKLLPTREQKPVVMGFLFLAILEP